MRNKVLELEKQMCKNYYAIPNEFKKMLNSLSSLDEVDLDTTIFTEAILMRLNAHYISENEIIDLLGKWYRKSGDDFFVETILFYLKFLISKLSPNLLVYSGRTIVRRGAIKPDISIWDGDRLVAIIECRTMLGSERYSWEQKFFDRERKLKEIYPNAKAYLLVLTGAHWFGFCDLELYGEKYFLLSYQFPENTNINAKETIAFPIEKLLSIVLQDYNKQRGSISANIGN